MIAATLLNDWRDTTDDMAFGVDARPNCLVDRSAGEHRMCVEQCIREVRLSGERLMHTRLRIPTGTPVSMRSAQAMQSQASTNGRSIVMSSRDGFERPW